MMQRRAHMLLVAVVVTGMVGTTLFVLNRHTRGITLNTQQLQLDAEAAQLLVAGKWWVTSHQAELTTLQAGDVRELDVSSLIAAGERDASLRIRRISSTIDAPAGDDESRDEVRDQNEECRLNLKARVASGRQESVIEVDLTIPAGD